MAAHKGRKSIGGRVCAAKFCKNTDYKTKLSFFRFPKDKERARRWACAAGRNDLMEKDNLHNTFRLCASHFEAEMFLNFLKNRLKPNAIPTIFPDLEGPSTVDDHNYSFFVKRRTERSLSLHDDTKPRMDEHSSQSQGSKVLLHEISLDEELNTVHNISFGSSTSHDSSFSSTSEGRVKTPLYSTSTSSTQTCQSLSINTPRHENMKKNITYLKNKLKLLEKKNRELSTDLERKNSQNTLDHITLAQYQQLTYKFCPNEKLATFINKQISECQKSSQGRRFTLNFKRDCLEI